MCSNDTVLNTIYQKNHQLFLQQKALIEQFLERDAITQAQYDKRLHDSIRKMNECGE
jgi:hypothetical protein